MDRCEEWKRQRSGNNIEEYIYDCTLMETEVPLIEREKTNKGERMGSLVLW